MMPRDASEGITENGQGGKEIGGRRSLIYHQIKVTSTSWDFAKCRKRLIDSPSSLNLRLQNYHNKNGITQALLIQPKGRIVVLELYAFWIISLLSNK